MEFQRANLDTCAQATGTVVVIDVLRAFTTAAYAFAAGAASITLVSTTEQALELKARLPPARTMGEYHGLPIPGFDYSNSPAELDGIDLRGCHLIQRTSAGTQGVVRSQQAHTLLTASFVCASATAATLRRAAPAQVTFVITEGDEDVACADYLEALLTQPKPALEPYLQRVLLSPAGQSLGRSAIPGYLAADLEYATAANRFSFFMQVQKKNDLMVMQPIFEQSI